jgi:hypothetical protein
MANSTHTSSKGDNPMCAYQREDENNTDEDSRDDKTTGDELPWGNLGGEMFVLYDVGQEKISFS